MKIGVIIVTFNRLSELRKTIHLYDNQTMPPEYIIVVDNHSTDGTDLYLKEWCAESSKIPHIVLTLPENIGGSGGFYEGMKKALEYDADWIWLADDDAYIDIDAFEQFNIFEQQNKSVVEEAAALSAAVYTDDGYAQGHRCRMKKYGFMVFERPVSASEYQKEYFEIDYYSFVGALVKKNAVKVAGLPRKDFFIYHDDYEHAERIRKEGKMYCIPAARVKHLDNSNTCREAGWRDYYSTRNILIMYKEHYGKAAFVGRMICRMLTALRDRNPEKLRVFIAAIKDALVDKTGIHPVYRPGWQPKKKYTKK